ncbi:hypothetical protein RAC89_13850 [Paenibacillus sp. GD4]|uniref:hypothetical protein n=1 Tax=Paenibacillus sp. GD4 TaxID=3068890 RepID=UPI002796A64F|nr:hypothetical protein [Paenibacillus sp. GD4]MDQ1911517.1 hypothetical protein [Paenibacillus sp. GD4]
MMMKKQLTIALLATTIAFGSQAMLAHPVSAPQMPLLSAVSASGRLRIQALPESAISKTART